MTGEEWKPCFGYEDCYAVSSLGRLARTTTYGGKPCWKLRAPALKVGYRSYHMCKNGVRKYRLAHLLVWESFKGPVPDGLEVNHKNGDRDDPSLTNLELMTRSENAKHSFQVLGRAKFNRPQHGSRNGEAKLTEADIPQIFDLAAQGVSRKHIAHRYDVSTVLVGKILRREAWRHVVVATPKTTD